MAYPTKIDNLVSVSALDSLAAAGHAARHNDVNDALDEIKVVLTVPAANTLALAPGGTERLRIDSAGNVGIGTSSPATVLEVNGTFRSGNAQVGSGLSTGSAFMEIGENRSDDGNAYIDLHGTAATDYETRLLRASGANGNLSLTNTGTGVIRITAAGAGAFTVSTSNTERMRIASDGLITGTGPSLGAWTAWTPTFTGFTVGNATLDFAYSKIGKTVHLRGSMIFGSTSAIPGPLDLTLPLSLSSGYKFIQNIGRVTVYDVGGDVYFGDMVKISGGTGGNIVRCLLNLALGTTVANQEIAATTPMTWVTGDALFINGTFESA